MLYLVRHAHALDTSPDAERALSPKGREQAERLAAFLKRSQPEPPEEIWHSPLLRARETAEIVAAGLRWKAPLRETPGLLPDDPPGIIAKRLTPQRSLALFGHSPYMALLATLLVTGRTFPAVFHFRKGSALALESGGGRPGEWMVQWHLDPHLLE
jgi:phosphohistidine phosphatase